MLGVQDSLGRRVECKMVGAKLETTPDFVEALEAHEACNGYLGRVALRT